MILRYIDFEYNKANEAKRDLVSMATQRKAKGEMLHKWLYQDPRVQDEVKTNLRLMRNAVILVAFNVEAEAGSMISLGLDPTKFKWIDLQKEWRMLCNHCDKYRYGEQLFKGKVKFTHNPVIKRNLLPQKIAKMSFAKSDSNLAAACFKLTGKRIDTEHKDEMRDIILALDGEQPDEEVKRKILEYNSDDVRVLPDMWKAIKAAYKELPAKVTLEEILYRGETSARTALIECTGYPVSKSIRNFSFAVPDILQDCAKDILEQFPDSGVFYWNKANNRYSMARKPQYEFIKKSGLARKWKRSLKTKELSLELDEWVKHFPYRSPYPRDNFAAQMIRYGRLKQSLNGFMPKGKHAKDKTTFFDSLGSDYRCRPYLNPYGSQSARWQPKATSYIPLKSSWMRYFIQPRRGRAICGIDYKSQEFLIAALLSGDERMARAYQSGDVYLAFGKDAGILPPDADKSHPLRAICKQIVLAIQYLMGAVSLASVLTEISGKKCSEEKSQSYIDKFHSTYKPLTKWQKSIWKQYRKDKYLKLFDGWVMYGHNQNHRSVTNMPIQGMGSVILRKAIKYCQDDGLKVILPLHDALYCEVRSNDEVVRFKQHMKQAFIDCFPDSPDAESIMLDCYAWGYDVDDIVTEEDVHTMRRYVEDRSRAELDRFSKYFLGDGNEKDW